MARLVAPPSDAAAPDAAPPEAEVDFLDDAFVLGRLEAESVFPIRGFDILRMDFYIKQLLLKTIPIIERLFFT